MSAISLVFIISAAASAQSRIIETLPFEVKQGSHLARVVFRTRVFARARHRNVRIKQGQTMVDGRLAIGTDGNLPSVEIASMRFYLDGKEIKVPRRLYADCFDPRFDHDSVMVEFGEDNESVNISMSGSDGAGAYHVIWRLRRDGQHGRTIN